MSIITPNGLKIRLHQERVYEVLAPVHDRIDIAGALRDIELWANLPAAALAVTVIGTAWATTSLLFTVLLSCVAFLLANLFQQFFYSRTLKTILPQFLGSRFVAVPISLIVGYLLFRRGAAVVAVTQLAIVLASIVGLADLLLLLFMPVRIAARAIAGRTVRDLGDIELAFVRILNQRAQDVGSALDRSIYDERKT